MMQDGVGTEYLTVPINRDHGCRRGGRRRVIAKTSLYRQRDRETLQRQLDLAHEHAELNGKIDFEEEFQDKEQEWDPDVAEFMV